MTNPVQGRSFFLVHPARFELATPGSEDQCSNPLSYGCSSEFTLDSAVILQASGKIPGTVGRYSSSQLNRANRSALQLDESQSVEENFAYYNRDGNIVLLEK